MCIRDSIWTGVKYSAILSTAVEKEKTNGILNKEITENRLNNILSFLLLDSFLLNTKIIKAGIAFIIILISPPSEDTTFLTIYIENSPSILSYRNISPNVKTRATNTILKIDFLCLIKYSLSRIRGNNIIAVL